MGKIIIRGFLSFHARLHTEKTLFTSRLAHEEEEEEQFMRARPFGKCRTTERRSSSSSSGVIMQQ